MSEPPSKKRKTILDFFRRKEKGTSLQVDIYTHNKFVVHICLHRSDLYIYIKVDLYLR